MNPLFTLREEFRFHDSSRFRKKAGDAKLGFYHSFVPVLMSLAAGSCRSRAESVHLFTMVKGLKEFQLCDSRRLRKKPQDAHDDVTELFDLFDAHFWVGKVYRIWTPKVGPPQYVLGAFPRSRVSYRNLHVVTMLVASRGSPTLAAFITGQAIGIRHSALLAVLDSVSSVIVQRMSWLLWPSRALRRASRLVHRVWPFALWLGVTVFLSWSAGFRLSVRMGHGPVPVHRQGVCQGPWPPASRLHPFL